jgi:hypothetical protein
MYAHNEKGDYDLNPEWNITRPYDTNISNSPHYIIQTVEGEEEKSSIYLYMRYFEIGGEYNGETIYKHLTTTRIWEQLDTSVDPVRK